MRVENVLLGCGGYAREKLSPALLIDYYERYALAQLTDGVKHSENPKICPVCGFESEGNAVFCLSCGLLYSERSYAPENEATPIFSDFSETGIADADLPNNDPPKADAEQNDGAGGVFIAKTKPSAGDKIASKISSKAIYILAGSAAALVIVLILVNSLQGGAQAGGANRVAQIDGYDAVRNSTGYIIQEPDPIEEPSPPEEGLPAPEAPLSMNTWPPSDGDLLVISTPKGKGMFIRSEPYVNGSGTTYADGNKIGYIHPEDYSVQLVSNGVVVQDTEGYYWFGIQIPEWYRNDPWQNSNYGGKPMVGYVREDVVQLLRRENDGSLDWSSITIP